MTRTAFVELPPEMRRNLDTALDRSLPVVIAYTEDDGNLKPTYRGSLHMHTASRLAFWARQPQGGIVDALRARPEVEVVYRDPEADHFYRITGHAEVVTDPAVTEAVFAGCPPKEQAADPDRLGVAVVIDILRVAGQTPAGPFAL